MEAVEYVGGVTEMDIDGRLVAEGPIGDDDLDSPEPAVALGE